MLPRHFPRPSGQLSGLTVVLPHLSPPVFPCRPSLGVEKGHVFPMVPPSPPAGWGPSTMRAACWDLMAGGGGWGLGGWMADGDHLQGKAGCAECLGSWALGGVGSVGWGWGLEERRPGGHRQGPRCLPSSAHLPLPLFSPPSISLPDPCGVIQHVTLGMRAQLLPLKRADAPAPPLALPDCPLLSYRASHVGVKGMVLGEEVGSDPHLCHQLQLCSLNACHLTS